MTRHELIDGKKYLVKLGDGYEMLNFAADGPSGQGYFWASDGGVVFHVGLKYGDESVMAKAEWVEINPDAVFEMISNWQDPRIVDGILFLNEPKTTK